MRRADFGPLADRVHGWHFAAHPPLVEQLGRRMMSCPPTLSTASAASFAGEARWWPPPTDPSPMPFVEHRRALVERLADGPAGGPVPPANLVVDPLVAAVDQLATLSEVVAERRARWAQTTTPEPGLDRRTAEMWRAFMQGTPWAAADTWHDLFCEPLVAGYLAVVEGVGASDARSTTDYDLREGYFYVLVGEANRVPGWRKVFARLVEGAPGGPIASVYAQLDEVSRRRFGDGAAARPYGRNTLALLCPEVDAIALRADLAAERYPVDASVDLHVACRLVDAWVETAPGGAADTNIVVQNQGRIRTRLRALLAEGQLDAEAPPPGGEAGLYARTVLAVKRYGRAWAQSRRAYRFTPYTDAEVDPPCATKADPRPPLTPEAGEALRCWLLTVALGGGLERLHDWVFRGGTGDRDTAHGRRMKSAPEALKVAGRAGDTAGYRHLRSVLARRWPELVGQIRPTLEAVARIDPESRGRRGAILKAIEPGWDPAQKHPSGRTSNVEHARASLDWLAGEKSCE